jgi:hypothetical protein
MAITTVHPLYTEWFTINGESMATYGWGVESVTTGLPERKGENPSSPIMHGNIFREKRFGARTDTWNIWVCDADPETGEIPATEEGKRAQFNTNMDYVNRILNGLTPNGLNNGSLEIVKHYLIPSETDIDGWAEDSVVAYGEVFSSYSYEDPKQFNCAIVSVEMSYPDPFWRYSSNSTLTFDGSGVQADYTISKSDIGNAPVTSLVITITATSSSVVNPIVTNTTLTNYPCSIGFTGTLTSGQSITIDTSAYTLYKGATNSISSLYRTGYRQDWFEFYPTVDNTIQTVSSSGNFEVEFSYKKAYF